MSALAERNERASYAAASLSLYLQAHWLGVDLGEVTAVLCEDGRTVMLSAHDMEIRASFVLAKKTSEAKFDRRKYEEGFDEN